MEKDPILTKIARYGAEVVKGFFIFHLSLTPGSILTTLCVAAWLPLSLIFPIFDEHGPIVHGTMPSLGADFGRLFLPAQVHCLFLQ